MKIAQVSPLFESVPPKGYGGTERVISYLTEELVRQGHEVTLFAAGDSETAARLISVAPRAMRHDGSNHAWLAYHTVQMDVVGQLADSFDVIHFHTDYMQFAMTRLLGTPHVSTLHGRLDLPELIPLYRHFSDEPLISISDNQRKPLPWVNWRKTVYHGLPPDLYEFVPESGDYFVFIGRISPEKRVDRAIEIAKRCGMRLYIGAKIDKADEQYFNSCIKPLLQHPKVQYLGEINQREKQELLGHASALLFPIDWPEPFGLVMIEAFSCGTPVIAYPHGSVMEIMEDGVTGFVVHDLEEAVQAAENIHSIDRRCCRNAFEGRFTAERMAENYLRVYHQLLAG